MSITFSGSEKKKKVVKVLDVLLVISSLIRTQQSNNLYDE